MVDERLAKCNGDGDETAVSIGTIITVHAVRERKRMNPIKCLK